MLCFVFALREFGMSRCLWLDAAWQWLSGHFVRMLGSMRVVQASLWLCVTSGGGHP